MSESKLKVSGLSSLNMRGTQRSLYTSLQTQLIENLFAIDNSRKVRRITKDLFRYFANKDGHLRGHQTIVVLRNTYNLLLTKYTFQ